MKYKTIYGVVIGVLLLVGVGTGVGAQDVQEDPLAGHPDVCSEDLDLAQVRDVSVQSSGAGLRFSVTVEHNDNGWDYYADGWVVVHPEDGTVFGERVLAHPHDNEQPFTRSLSDVSIPNDVDEVLVVARNNVRGFGGCGQLVSVR
ncbi:MAG: hypothetical protein ACOCYB_07330 [Alkalispirochaeta sp.]